MRKVTVALSALSITALALAGCSDPDSKTETPASQETTQSQGAASSDSAEGFDFSGSS